MNLLHHVYEMLVKIFYVIASIFKLFWFPSFMDIQIYKRATIDKNRKQ